MEKLISPFYLEESTSQPGKYIVKVHHEQFHCKSTLGSYSLLGARLLNISWANYLRLCRDEYGAEIYGKDTYYPIAYFNKDKKAELLIETLNRLASMVEWERVNSKVVEWMNEKQN